MSTKLKRNIYILIDTELNAIINIYDSLKLVKAKLMYIGKHSNKVFIDAKNFKKYQIKEYIVNTGLNKIYKAPMLLGDNDYVTMGI